MREEGLDHPFQTGLIYRRLRAGLVEVKQGSFGKEYPLFLKSVRGAFRLIFALGAGLAILAAVLAWRLTSGPISLAFLTPHIESALNVGVQPLKITLGDTILRWGGWERTLDIRVLGVRVAGAEGAVLAQVPEISVSLSAEAMLYGLVAPRRIEIFRPTVNIVHYADGHFGVGVSLNNSDGGGQILALIKRMLDRADETSPIDYLTQLDIADATLNIEDRAVGTSWQTTAVQIQIRRDSTGIKSELSMRPKAGGRQSSVTVMGDYRNGSNNLDLGVAFGNLSPISFASLIADLPGMSGLDLPVGGTLALTLNLDGEVLAIGFDLKSGKGRIVLPGPLAQDVAVDTITVRGRYDNSSGILDIEDLAVAFATDTKIKIDPIGGHQVPMRSLRAQARYFDRENRFELSRLEADLNGPSATVSGTVSGIGGDLEATAKGALRNVPLSRIKNYWPADWGADPYAWVTTHMADGQVSEAEVDVALKADGKGGFAIERVDGTMALSDITVEYLPPMPKVFGASGTATFDRKRFDITLTGGRSTGLEIRSGTIALTGLDVIDQYADVDLKIDGPVQNALRLIDHEPFSFASAIGIDPTAAGGTLSTRLKLYFIVEKTVTRDQVKVQADADLENVSIAKGVRGLDLSAGRFNLRADNRGMDLSGMADIGTMGGTISWRESFVDNSAVRSRYGFRGNISVDQWSRELGINYPPFTGNIFNGPFGVDLEFTIKGDNRRDLDARLDLTGATLALDPLGWSKAAGVAGTAHFEMQFKGEKPERLSRFSISAGNLVVNGSGQFDGPAHSLSRLTFDSFDYPGTSVKGVLLPREDNGWDADFYGASFNMVPILDSVTTPDESEETGPPFTLSLNVERVELGGERYLKSVAGALSSDGEKWNAILLQGLLKGDKRFTLHLRPGEPGKRHLTIRSDDAGEALRSFDIYENMIGGALEIIGDYDDKALGAPLSGVLVAKNFSIVRAPAIARIVSVLAITGIPEALRGEGLGFSDLEVPFTLNGGVLDITEAVAKSVSLGFTASGRAYPRTNVINLEGTAVPAYLINSALGGIPLIGSIFTGGELGGGIFAANYSVSGPIEEPNVKVNPLSAFAPGFLRRIFDIFDTKPPPLDQIKPADSAP